VPVSFFIIGTAAFALAGFARAACALPDTGQDLHFTWLNPALAQLNYYGFFAMAMFGAESSYSRTLVNRCE